MSQGECSLGITAGDGVPDTFGNRDGQLRCVIEAPELDFHGGAVVRQLDGLALGRQPGILGFEADGEGVVHRAFFAVDGVDRHHRCADAVQDIILFVEIAVTHLVRIGVVRLLGSEVLDSVTVEAGEHHYIGRILLGSLDCHGGVEFERKHHVAAAVGVFCDDVGRLADSLGYGFLIAVEFVGVGECIECESEFCFGTYLAVSHYVCAVDHERFFGRIYEVEDAFEPRVFALGGFVALIGVFLEPPAVSILVVAENRAVVVSDFLIVHGDVGDEVAVYREGVYTDPDTVVFGTVFRSTAGEESCCGGGEAGVESPFLRCRQDGIGFAVRRTVDSVVVSRHISHCKSVGIPSGECVERFGVGVRPCVSGIRIPGTHIGPCDRRIHGKEAHVDSETSHSDSTVSTAV